MNIVAAMMKSGKVEIGQFVVENNGTMTNHQHAAAEGSAVAARFPASLGYEQGMAVLDALKEQGFVPASTNPSEFLYQMGCTDECPAQLHPVVWLKTKQLLREMLEFWYRQLITDKALSKARIEEICPRVFVNQNGLQLSLAKPKPVPSIESDDLRNIFATI